jgi:HAD superfamily hydrolase (TIGR01509 family)
VSGPADSLAAVVFDLDGVLLESEQVWTAAKRELAQREGGRWDRTAEGEMLGMSSTEWSRYMHERLSLKLAPADISAAVAELVAARYRAALPLIEGAERAVRALASRWRLALASSSNREVISLVLELAGWSDLFAEIVSSEEVARGKPSPDVYLEAARRLAAEPARCVAIEDSDAGIRAALSAGLAVIATPNRAFPPAATTLQRADVVLATIARLDAETVLAAARRAASRRDAHSVRQVSSSE